MSSARQAADGLPVQSQIEQCRAKAAAVGAVVVREFRDEGISGRTTKRPAFLEAVDFCEEERIEYFICWSTSRFARNRIDAALYKRTLERFGTRLVYASQDFGEGDDAWLPETAYCLLDEALGEEGGWPVEPMVDLMKRIMALCPGEQGIELAVDALCGISHFDQRQSYWFKARFMQDLDEAKKSPTWRACFSSLGKTVVMPLGLWRGATGLKMCLPHRFIGVMRSRIAAVAGT